SASSRSGSTRSWSSSAFSRSSGSRSSEGFFFDDRASRNGFTTVGDQLRAFWDFQIGNVHRSVQSEIRDIEFEEVRNFERQTFNLNVTANLADETAFGRTDRFTSETNFDVHANGFRHIRSEEVHVNGTARDRVNVDGFSQNLHAVQ